MEKTKEEIEILRKGTLNRYKHDTYNECLDIIDQKLQDYTFIRVPKKVKLSEIFAYMRMKECLLEEERYQCYIWTAYYATIKMNISKESTICNIQIDSTLNKFKFKWLYELWIAGTFIEVDV